jgi:uncharacterized protein YjlB
LRGPSNQNRLCVKVLGQSGSTAWLLSICRVRFGGDNGQEIDVAAGDVAVLPAGTGHQCLSASEDFLVVGAYPPEGTYDECRGSAEERAEALKTIPGVPLPHVDPVHGVTGPLPRLWR